MTCQICKAMLGVGLNMADAGEPAEKGSFWWLNRKEIEGRKGAPKTKGGFDFNAPHIVMIALYAGGLGAKRVLDRVGEHRRKVQPLLEVLKQCGVYEEGRRPPDPVADPLTAIRNAEKKAAMKAESMSRVEARKAIRLARPRAKSTRYYYANHKENKIRHAARARARHATIKHTADYKIKRAARNAVSRIARVSGCGKDGRTLAYLGCTMATARAWIEQLFRNGMTWLNHGDAWEIDHAKPLAAFDLKDPAQRLVATHYTNLQPLWKHENRAKADRYDEEYDDYCAI